MAVRRRMASSACYEDAVAFSTVQSSRPRPDPRCVLQSWRGRNADATAAIVPALVHYAANGVGESVNAVIRLLDELRRVAVVEAAAGRRIPPRTCHELVDACLRIANRVAQNDEKSGRWSPTAYARGDIVADVRGPLRAFFANPPLTHGVIEAIAAVGQGYQDFGPQSL